jgi:hypothetical protein
LGHAALTGSLTLLTLLTLLTPLTLLVLLATGRSLRAAARLCSLLSAPPL